MAADRNATNGKQEMGACLYTCSVQRTEKVLPNLTRVLGTCLLAVSYVSVNLARIAFRNKQAMQCEWEHACMEEEGV